MNTPVRQNQNRGHTPERSEPEVSGIWVLEEAGVRKTHSEDPESAAGKQVEARENVGEI